MQQNVKYALVGIFVIVLGSAWMGISLWLAYGDLDTSYRSYQIYMNESVSGLYVDAPVKFRGVEVGKVRDMELNPWNNDQVRILVDIDKDVLINTDTVATLKVQGLTGIAHIGLKGGSVDAPPLEDGEDGEPPVLQSGPSLFVRVDAAVSELLLNVNLFINNANQLLSKKTSGSLQRTLDNLEAISQVLADRKADLDTSLQSASGFFENTDEAFDGLPAMVEQFSESAVAIEKMANNLAAAGGSIDKTIQDAGQHITTMGEDTLPKVDTLVGELRRLTTTLDRVLRQIEEEPRLFIYGNDLRAPGPGE